MSSQKSSIRGSIIQYPRISKPHDRTLFERELGTFGRANRWNLCHFGRAFEEAAAILIAIEYKYMLLCAFFNSLPNFFDIETNFPRNYNKLVLCHQSSIGGNKLIKMATMYWKLPSWEMVSGRKTTGSLHIIYRGYLESFFVFTLHFVSLV